MTAGRAVFQYCVLEVAVTQEVLTWMWIGTFVAFVGLIQTSGCERARRAQPQTRAEPEKQKPLSFCTQPHRSTDTRILYSSDAVHGASGRELARVCVCVVWLLGVMERERSSLFLLAFVAELLFGKGHSHNQRK